MNLLRSFARDERGSPVIEFAIAVPTLVSIIYGIAQLGFIYEASAGMSHALGEAARFATIFDTTKTTHVHTNDEIVAKANEKLFGMGNVTPTITIPSSGTGWLKLQITYTKKLDFLFMTGPTVTLTRSKVIYTVTST
ncbi:MAG: TadE/TadG family type IV pilus assembly protein [Sphingomicrobium sp.]